MARIQLALNVDDLDAAVAFYSKLFDTPPAKLRPGYANFAVAEPPLKLVLFEQPGKGGTINHLGVEVEGADEVDRAQARLAGADLPTVAEDSVACCYARQDKVWVEGPSGEPWEIYTVLEHVETGDRNGCCTTVSAGLRGPNAVAGLRGPNAVAGLGGPNAVTLATDCC